MIKFRGKTALVKIVFVGKLLNSGGKQLCVKQVFGKND
jgi:hypothetical protein